MDRPINFVSHLWSYQTLMGEFGVSGLHLRDISFQTTPFYSLWFIFGIAKYLIHFTQFSRPVHFNDFGVSTGGGILFILANRLSIALQIEDLENLPDNQGLIWIHCINDRDFGYLFIYTYVFDDQEWYYFY